MLGKRSRFNLEVTAADIEKARIKDGEGDSFRCMVAQAIARQLTNAHRIDVDLQTIRWTDEHGRHVFLTPYEVAGYVVAFDAGEPIEPFRFHLRNAVPALQKKAQTQAAKAVQRAQGAVSNAKRRQRQEQAVLDDPAAPPKRKAAAKKAVQQAPAEIAEARKQVDDVRAAYKAAGERTSRQRSGEATRKAPPRVFKTKQRMYGQRVLRVNQAPGRKHYAG